jgi:hypothetical protein
MIRPPLGDRRLDDDLIEELIEILIDELRPLEIGVLPLRLAILGVDERVELGVGDPPVADLGHRLGLRPSQPSHAAHAIGAEAGDDDGDQADAEDRQHHDIAEAIALGLGHEGRSSGTAGGKRLH